MLVLCGVLLSRVGNNTERRILRDVASTHIVRMWCVVVTSDYNTRRRILRDVAATHCCFYLCFRLFILLCSDVSPLETSLHVVRIIC